MYYPRVALLLVVLAVLAGLVGRGGAQTLGEALDTPGRDWESVVVDGIGAGVWLGQTVETHDGVDAAACTPETPGAFKAATVLKVTGPKRIAFFWRLDTGAPVDLLRLRRDEIDMLFAEPDIGWHGGSAVIPTGDYSLLFKVQQFVEGMSPTAYVDEVSITEPLPTDDAQIVDQPAGLTVVDAGVPVTLRATAFGALPMTFQWFHDGLPLPGAIDLVLTLANPGADDGGVYEVVATGSTGVPSASEEAEVMVLDTAAGALAEAVDQGGMAFTQGSTPWGRQVLVAGDGEDSARSRTPPPGGVSEFSAVISGPVKLVFDLDYELDLARSAFLLMVDGEERYRSAGFSSGFSEVQVGLGPGTHDVRWRFDRGTSNNEQQAVYVDRIRLTPADEGPPLFHLNPPSKVDLYPGDDLVLEAAAVGEMPLTYQWTRGGVDLLGEVSGTLTIPGAGAGENGIYRCVAENGQGTGVSGEADVLFHANPSGELATALDVAMLGAIVISAGDAAWLPQRSVVLTGGLAARAGRILDGQTSDLRIDVVGPGKVLFSWKASAEAAGDVLSFRVDQSEAARVSGLSDWETVGVEIAPGAHMLTWRYRKAAAGSIGTDTGYLDQVIFVPSAGQTAPMFATEPEDRVVTVGAGVELSASLAEGQTFPVTFQWVKDGVPLAGEVGLGLLIPAVTVADAGEYEVVASNSLGETRSRSAELRVEVDAGLRCVVLSGTGEVQVSWDEGVDTYAVESTESLVAPVSWSGVQGTPVLVEGRRVLSIPPGVAARFFRLVRGEG